MFGIGGFELFLILLFGFLIFGPDKLPAIAKTIGKAIGKFRSAQEEMNKVIKTEVYDPASDEPFKNPLEAFSKSSNAGKDDKKEVKTESFSERKAKYDKERAAKRVAETQAAERDAAKGKTYAKKAESSASPATKPKEISPTAKTDKASKLTLDELYGIKTTDQKPVSSSAAQVCTADEKDIKATQGDRVMRDGDAPSRAKEQSDEAAYATSQTNEKGE